MRSFEYIDDTSAKFWEVEQADTELNIRWGRIGTQGQSQTKSFADAAKANAAMVKLVKEKTGKGYGEVAAAADATLGSAPAKALAGKTIAPIPTDQAAGTAAPDAQAVAIELLSRATAGPVEVAPSAPQVLPDTATSAVPPWLLLGEPLRLGDGADRTVRELAHATRRFPKPINAADPQRAWQQLRQALLAAKDADFAGSDAALRDDYEAAWQCLNSATFSGTLHTDAVLMALGLSQEGYNDIDFGTQFVDSLVASHGLPYTIDAWLQAQHIEVQEEYVRNGKNKWRLTYTVTEPWTRSYYGPLGEGEWCLRTHLAAAPQADYDACVDKVRKALVQVEPVRQPALALLFPDVPELSHALIYTLCAPGVDTPDTVHWLQLTATDPAALTLARKVKTSCYSNFWSRPDMVSTILLERGVQAFQWLAAGAEQDAAGDALTRIGTPEALDALARVASSSKGALARFALAVDRWPAAALVALARLLSGTSKDQSLLTPALIRLLRAYPEWVTPARHWLELAGRALVDKLQARLAGPADIADPEELPPVLAAVPWLQASKKATQSLKLQPLPLSAVEQWEAGEKEAARQLSTRQSGRYQMAVQQPDVMADELGFDRKALTPEHKRARDAIKQGDAANLVEAWRAMLVEKKKASYYYGVTLDGYAVAHLPAALGIPFWNSVASEGSSYGMDFVAATWGLAAFPGVLAKISSAPTENMALALHFGAIELAPVAARAFAKLKSLRGLGRQWLKRFP